MAQVVSVARTQMGLPPRLTRGLEQTRSFPPRARLPTYHAVMWLQQCVNYYIQTILTGWHLFRFKTEKRETTGADVVAYILNSACVLYCKPVGGDAPDRHVFELRDFVFFDYPASGDSRCSTLRVEFSLEGEPRVLGFWLDGAAIASAAEQLGLVMVIESVAVHPIIHGFHDVLYHTRGELPDGVARRIFLHGAFLNAAASWLPSTLLGVPIEVFAEVAHANALDDVPMHTVATLEGYARHSRFVRFVLPVRAVFMKLCKRHQIDVHLEAFFLCSVMHSIDHYCMELCVDSRKLSLSCLPACAADPRRLTAYHLMFIRESQYVGSNKLKDQSHRHPFFSELLRELRAIDAELADHVTVSLSY